MLHHPQQVLINMKECKVEIIPNIVAGEIPYQQYTNQEKTLIGVPVIESSALASSLGSENQEQSLFSPNDPGSTIETSIYDLNGEYVNTIYDLKDYTVTDDTNNEGSGSINTLNLDPAAILAGVGIAFGTFTIVNRFLKNRLSTNQENQDIFIEEISSDRTEVRLNSTKIPSEELTTQTSEFINELSNEDYFEDFYLNFGQNQLYIANNILVDTQTDPENPSILVHLYEPLPDNVQTNETLYIVTEQADPLNLSVELPLDSQPIDIEPEEVPYLEGPNFNVEIQNQFNTPTDFLSYNNLTQVPLTSSYNQLQNILKKRGVNISSDYTKFDEFVHFSSAKQRLNNFYYKVDLIESASFELNQLSSAGNNFSVSSSKSSIETTISNIVSNFDGFENYMYYQSNSLAWPKQNLEPPYTLYGTGSTEVLEWFGSDIPSNQYFGGRIESASNFDNQNPDALVKTIPEYLRDDPDNAPYDLFINMIGQHFEDLYLYTKNVTNRYNNDNRLDVGISKDLVAQALRDFGVKLYQNNFSSNDLYSAFLGINASGSWSGSAQSKYKEYGDLQLVLRKGNTLEYVTSSKVNLPFFNGDWWSVMVRRDQSFGVDDVGTPVAYDIICKSKPYYGADGTKIALEGSGSLDNTSGDNIPEINSAWSYFSQSSAVNTSIGDGTIFQPGTGYGARFGYSGNQKAIGSDIKIPFDTYFSGSIQEVRYYNLPLSESVFDDYVMNPESIEGISISGSGSSFDTVGFRAALGDELVLPKNNTQGIDRNFQVFTSIHPSITSSYGATTGSFLIADYTDSPTGDYVTASNYYIRDNQEIGGDVHRYALSNDEVFYIDQPVVGIKNRISDKIRLENTQILGNALSSLQDIEDDPITNKSYTKDINYLEVAFSPQNEINDDIIASLGYFDIGGYIGDPRQVTQSNYPDLELLQQEYFKKYSDNYNLKDYIRLIKYFDNSLFKMIKDFVPARTGLSTGVVIKQHLLERNKYITPQVTPSLPNYSESIDVASMEGGQGGAFEFEGKNKIGYNFPPQESTEEINTISGVFTKTHSDESEYYDGELTGTELVATDGEVSPEDSFEPLYGNADDSTRSDLYFTVEYDDGDIIASNLDDIIDGNAQPADVEDFNYFSPRSFFPRYDGSKHFSVAFGSLNRSTGYVPVDPGSVYFTNIIKAYDTSPEFINKTFVSIDKFVTQNSDVYDPRNQTIPQFTDFQHTFKKTDIVDVKIDALNDVRTYDELPGSHSILNIGRYNTLLATNQSTASFLPSGFVDGASGSRISRINMVPPDAIDQGDPIIILPDDPSETIPTPVNFKFRGNWTEGGDTQAAYYMGQNNQQNQADLNQVKIYGLDKEIPHDNDDSKFGMTGFFQGDGNQFPGRSTFPNSSPGLYEQSWSEQGYNYFSSNNWNIDNLGGSTEDEYVIYQFTKDTNNADAQQNIKAKIKLHLFLMNYNSLGSNDRNVTVTLRARDAQGNEKWTLTQYINVDANGTNDEGYFYLFNMEKDFQHYNEGDYIVAFLQCDGDEVYIVTSRGNNDYDKSYFSVEMQSAISQPIIPEDVDEPLQGLPAQKFLNYFLADEVQFPETSTSYTSTSIIRVV